MRIFLFIFLIFLSACVKQKSILICGDHKCINKAEAKQYFEENLTLEIQIISKEKTKNFDLVDLNTKDEKPMIKILENKNKKVIKKLSKEEIKSTFIRGLFFLLKFTNYLPTNPIIHTI